MEFSHLHKFLVHLHHKTKNKLKKNKTPLLPENSKLKNEENSNSFSPPHFDGNDNYDDVDDGHDHCNSVEHAVEDKNESENGITRCEFCPTTKNYNKS